MSINCDANVDYMKDYNIVWWGRKMFDVNKLLDDAINENRNLNDGEIFLVKENEYLII